VGLLLEIDGGKSVTLKSGQSGSLPPRTVHDDKNASQTAPLKFLVFHVARKATLWLSRSNKTVSPAARNSPAPGLLGPGRRVSWTRSRASGSSDRTASSTSPGGTRRA